MPEDKEQAPVLLLTGLSGAGKSVALKALEDLGYEAVDNLPLTLLDSLLSTTGPERRLAIGIDVRTRAFDPEQVLKIIGRSGAEPPGGDHLAGGRRAGGRRAVRIVFLDCAGSVLARRFSETRRRHPLARDRPASDGIALEREILSPLRLVADTVIDTSDFNPHDLRRFIATRFAKTGHQPMTITVMSFGFSRGLPRDADMVLDMRFLANPHWEPALRPLTGENPQVQNYVSNDPAFKSSTDAIMQLLLVLLPRYRAEGRAYMTLAVGCTGGRHRSVAVAIAIGSRLSAGGWLNNIVHRDASGAPDTADTGGSAIDTQMEGNV